MAMRQQLANSMKALKQPAPGQSGPAPAGRGSVNDTPALAGPGGPATRGFPPGMGGQGNSGGMVPGNGGAPRGVRAMPVQDSIGPNHPSMPGAGAGGSSAGTATAVPPAPNDINAAITNLKGQLGQLPPGGPPQLQGPPMGGARMLPEVGLNGAGMGGIRLPRNGSGPIMAPGQGPITPPPQAKRYANMDPAVAAQRYGMHQRGELPGQQQGGVNFGNPQQLRSMIEARTMGGMNGMDGSESLASFPIEGAVPAAGGAAGASGAVGSGALNAQPFPGMAGAQPLPGQPIQPQPNPGFRAPFGGGMGNAANPYASLLNQRFAR